MLLPESNLHLRAAGCCALPARPAPGSKGVSATWFPAVFAGDFVWGRGGAGARRAEAVGDAHERESSRAPESRSCRPCAAGAALRPGPAGLDRSTGAVRSSVRSHHFSGSQHAIPRRQDCRLFAAARARRLWPGFRDQCGRMRSLWVARRRIWPQREAVDRPKLAIEPGRTGAQRSSHHARVA